MCKEYFVVLKHKKLLHFIFGNEFTQFYAND